MVARLLYSVEMVQIVAPNESRAFQLFESLNDRGLELSAADLIKNKAFARATDSHIEEVKTTWRDMVELIQDLEPVTFLRHYWIAFHGSVRKNNLYDEYERKLRTLEPQAVTDFVRNLKSKAQLYRHLAVPNPKTCPTAWGVETAERLRRIDVFRAKGCRPALLACAANRVEWLPALVEVCESVTVRYSIVGNKNPNALEKVYAQIAQKIGIPRISTELVPATDDLPLSFPKLAELLNELIPADKDFEKEFSELEVDSVTPTWREILVRLNDAYSTGETRIQGPDKVHVEHIFPQNPSTAALKESRVKAGTSKELARQIGNLTLLDSKFNMEGSNLPFSDKVKYYALSQVKLNEELAAMTSWNAKDVADRGERLAKQATKLWRWPVID